MSLNTYDPKQVNLVVAGQIMSGYAEDTFIEVSRNANSFELQMGADGDATRSRSNNKSGQLKLTLRQGSASNEALSALAVADEASNGSVFSFGLKDSSGTSLYAAATAWIVKPADSAFAVKSGTRQWMIETDNLQAFIGKQNA